MEAGRALRAGEPRLAYRFTVQGGHYHALGSIPTPVMLVPRTNVLPTPVMFVPKTDVQLSVPLLRPTLTHYGLSDKELLEAPEELGKKYDFDYNPQLNGAK